MYSYRNGSVRYNGKPIKGLPITKQKYSEIMKNFKEKKYDAKESVLNTHLVIGSAYIKPI